MYLPPLYVRRYTCTTAVQRDAWSRARREGTPPTGAAGGESGGRVTRLSWTPNTRDPHTHPWVLQQGSCSPARRSLAALQSGPRCPRKRGPSIWTCGGRRRTRRQTCCPSAQAAAARPARTREARALPRRAGWAGVAAAGWARRGVWGVPRPVRLILSRCCPRGTRWRRGPLAEGMAHLQGHDGHGELSHGVRVGRQGLEHLRGWKEAIRSGRRAASRRPHFTIRLCPAPQGGPPAAP